MKQKKTQKEIQKKKALGLDNRRPTEWIACLGLVAILVILALVLNRADPDAEPTAAQKRIFAIAKVTDVLGDNGEEDSWTEGLRLGTQELELKIISGEHKGQVLEATNYLNAYTNVDCKVGTRVIVRMDYDDSGDLYVVSIPNYDRGIVLAGFMLVFALLLIIIGGRKGTAALLGLVYTLLSLWYLLIPMILKGMNPILAAIFIVAITTAASLIFLTGFSRKTLCATLGCVGGVAAAGLFAAVVGAITPIGGFNMSEAEELVLRAYDLKLHISGLLVSGILISSLGAVMDVAMSIASSCNELKELNPQLTVAQLFRSGMNIGRDAMGTMANTLILAFAGSSLNMLILFRVYDYPLIQIINSDAMAIEIIQGVAGSIGIILTVPLVALISSRLIGRKSK